MQSRNNICTHKHCKPYNQTRTLTPNMSKIENRLLLKCAKRCQDRIISTCANKWWVFHGDRGHYANCMLHVKHNAIFTNTFFLHYMGWLVILLHAMHTRGCLCYSYNLDLLHVLHISINLKVVPQWEIKFKTFIIRFNKQKSKDYLTFAYKKTEILNCSTPWIDKK